MHFYLVEIATNEVLLDGGKPRNDDLKQVEDQQGKEVADNEPNLDAEKKQQKLKVLQISSKASCSNDGANDSACEPNNGSAFDMKSGE